MIYFAAFHLALARWSKELGFVVGLNLADRMRVANQSTVGFLLNLIPIISRIDPRMPFKAYLQIITKDVRNGYGHQDLSAELYEAIFNLGRSFCTPRFNYLPLAEHFTANMTRGFDAFEGVFVAPNMPKIHHFRDIHFNVVEYPHVLIGRFIYDADKFSLRNVKNFIKDFERVLDGISRHPESLLQEIIS
jgi:non-ribosomal peptide synthetase component F